MNEICMPPLNDTDYPVGSLLFWLLFRSQPRWAPWWAWGPMEGYRGALEEACTDWPQICSITTTPAPHQGTNGQVGHPAPKSPSRIPLVAAERMGQLPSKNSKLGRYEKSTSAVFTSIPQDHLTEPTWNYGTRKTSMVECDCSLSLCVSVLYVPNCCSSKSICVHVSLFSSIFIHLCLRVTVFIHFHTFCPMTYLKPHKLTNVDLCCQ